ncbi:MAG TPA: LiaF domain-containing protein [Anaerolineaceae bacterium]|nr:LiaF domain-containing protein [Anaerolineaceae bacterium]
MKLSITGSTGVVFGLVLVVMVAVVFGITMLRNPRGGKVLSEALSAPLNSATNVRIDLNAGSGNLTIDRLSAAEPALATGSLEYTETQGPPIQTLETSNGQTVLTLKTGKGEQPWLRLPWDACNGATVWSIHLNPSVPADLSARSGGGNLKLDLAGATITRLAAETGGGNVEVVLPDGAANLNAAAKTGAGNVTVAIGSGAIGSGAVSAASGAGDVAVHVPEGMAAKIHVSSGMGKVVVDPRFSMVDKNTYQSPNFDSAADRVEITASSGAGNVTIDTK